MKNLKKHQLITIGSSIAAIYGVLCLVAFASATSRTEKPAPVDAEQFADFMGHEVLDIQDLAEGAEVQRRMFNRITPPGLSWTQPMFPPVAPFDAQYFDEQFLEGLLGEDKSSAVIYPLSLMQDPKTRETLIYNAEGELIAAIPADRGSREWPADADPSRVILQLDLLPTEDVEPYLYTERRIEESLARHNTSRLAKSGGAATRGLEAGEFGFANMQSLTNGNILLTVTNGANVVEVFAYTVWHTSSVVVVTWTNEQSNVVTDTNTVWHQVSPAFNGLESEWECLTTNLVLTNGVGVYENANISSNARIRFYAVANRQDSDGDGLTDGMEIFVHHTNPQSIDTDGDGLLDGYDIPVWIGDPRYTAWANNIVFTSSEGLRIFKGELSAGSDPLADDTDSDGLPDGWEVQNALDPLDAEGENGAEGDPDGDGFDNALELELGAPANNSAWNGEQLAYRLTHVTPVIVTNARSITTNWIGLRVDIDDSIDCGGTAGTQDKRKPLDIPKLLDCGYFIDIRVHGMVEDVDVNYDKVSIEAFTNTFYFSGSYNRPRDCRMIPKTKTCNVLIMGNSTAYLRYNTVSYKWHSGAYAEIISATNTAPYKVVVSGEDAMCIGETISVTASGGSESNYTWFGYGGVSLSGTTSNSALVTGIAPGFASVSATDSKGCTGVKEIIVLKPDIGEASPLADRTLHPGAARKPLVLRQTLPGAWHGQMQLNLTGAVAYWTPTGGVPIALSSTFFANDQLPQTIYLEGNGCGMGEASFSIAGSGGCATNTPLQIFGANATLAGVAEADEESPGGFIADRTVHTNAPRTMLTLEACGPYGSPGNLILTWDSSVVNIYTAPSGGSALTQFVTPFHGFNGTNLYVEGVVPGASMLSWVYSEQTNCVDHICITVVKDEFQRDGDCSGFDDTLNPPWLMVPVNATNTALVLIYPANAADYVSFLSRDTGTATVAPLTADTSPEIVYLTGVSRGDTTIQSRLSSLNYECAALNVAVKARIDKTIAIHAITEENDDVQVIPLGQGQPNQTCITSGTNGILNSVTNGDDVVVGSTITTGPNGICETSASGDDVQVITVGKGKANATCVTKGANSFRDTIPAGDDVVTGDDIHTGADGVCNTAANAVNLAPANVPSASALEHYLNNSTWGKQANIHFTVSRYDTTVNYDLNRDGQLADPWAYSATWSEIDTITATAKVTSVDYNLYYVMNYEYPAALSEPQRGEAWVGDAHQGSTEYVTAHEIGHLLGREGHLGARVGIELMGSTDSAASPCQIIKIDWDYVNP